MSVTPPPPSNWLYDWKLESFKAVIQFALAAVKMAFLVNGGAVIVMLALLGNLWTKDADGRIAAQRIADDLTCPLFLFAFGLAAATLCAALSYLAQVFFTHFKNRIGLGFQIFAILLCFGSVFAFGLGSYFGIEAFTAKLISPLD